VSRIPDQSFAIQRRVVLLNEIANRKQIFYVKFDDTKSMLFIQSATDALMTSKTDFDGKMARLEVNCK